LIPLRLMDLAREDDHRGERPSRSINRFNNSHPFAIPWLYGPYTACSVMRCSNNLCCRGYTYLKASFIKVVDILFKNTIFHYSILNKIKPLVDDFWIFAFCTLVIIFASVFGYKFIMPFDESSNPSLTDCFPLSLME
jgi:hypothetical protein